MATIIRLNQSITDDTAPRIREVITSDDFSGSGELVGSLTSAALGGTPMQWEGEAGWTRHQGGIRTPQGSSTQVLELNGLPENYAASFKVLKLPDTGYVSVSTRMKNVGNRCLFGLTNTGSVWIENRVDSTTSRSDTASGVKVGDIITFETDGSNLHARINGELVLSYAAQIFGEGIMRLSAYPVVDAVLDDLIIEKR